MSTVRGRELLGVVARERKAFERLTAAYLQSRCPYAVKPYHCCHAGHNHQVLEQSLLAVDELARREMEAACMF